MSFLNAQYAGQTNVCFYRDGDHSTIVTDGLDYRHRLWILFVVGVSRASHIVTTRLIAVWRDGCVHGFADTVLRMTLAVHLHGETEIKTSFSNKSLAN